MGKGAGNSTQFQRTLVAQEMSTRSSLGALSQQALLASAQDGPVRPTCLAYWVQGGACPVLNTPHWKVDVAAGPQLCGGVHAQHVRSPGLTPSTPSKAPNRH